METVTLLGATGSVGRQTLDVLARHPERYRVLALTAGSRWRELAEQCLQWRPRFAALADEDAAVALRNHLREAGSDTEVLSGAAGIVTLAGLAEADIVVAAIVGAAGVRPTLAAVEAGKRILLANKETLVVTGDLFIQAVQRHGATLLPVDSEHNAIFQCLPEGGVGAGVKRLLLTASGGPFLGWSTAQLASVTPEQAVRHPNWSMGPKISVDSATLMNKGLELIEACWLFGVPPERIEVVVHPQSVVHSMVEYQDGSILAQMGTPDMRTPIACALCWPERMESGAPVLDFATLAQLEFRAPDHQAFPSLRLARRAMETGGTATAILNAANEEAVAAFLQRRLPFAGIAGVVAETLSRQPVVRGITEVDAVMEEDARARDTARQLIKEQAC